MDINSEKLSLTYNITENEYKSVIKFQKELKNRKDRFRKLLPDIIFTVVALYILLFMKQYNTFMRIAPVVMAIILDSLTVLSMSNSDSRAGRILNKMKKQEIVNNNYFSAHRFEIISDSLKITFGSENIKVKLCDIARIDIYKNVVILVSNGRIIEIIPLNIANENGFLESLIETIEKSKSDKTSVISEPVDDELPEECRKTFSSTIGFDEYVYSMVKSYRMYYSTRQAWKGNRTLDMLILLFGLYAVFSNVYIGIVFILAGIYLNRQMLVTFSPLCRNVVINGILSSQSYQEKEVKSQYIFTDKKLIMKNRFCSQNTYLKDIDSIRKDSKNVYVYTKDKNMFVLDGRMISKEEIKSLAGGGI